MSSTEGNPIPQGKYVPASRSGNLVFSAGMTPRNKGVLILSGKISSVDPIDTYKAAVRQATKNALTAVRNTLSDEEEIEKIITLTVYINAEDSFQSHSQLADFASDYLCDELGDAGTGSRTSIGVASLPGNAPVEIQLIASITLLSC